MPALEAILGAALERDALLREVVETSALRRSDDLKTALLRAVSHDLRSPLTAILTAVGALGSPSVSDDERDELVGDIGGEAERLSRLVDNLLDLSRLEARAAEPRVEWCSIEEVIVAAVDDVALPAGTFALALDRDLPLIRADAAQLERAFANLLENAARYSGGHPVSVRARAVGARVLVRVVDRGPGVPPPSGAHLRALLPRAGTDRQRSPRLRARAGHRARLRRGQRRARVGRVAARPGHDLRGRAAAGAGAGVSDARPGVLVVDDEPQILRALKVILRDAGFEVDRGRRRSRRRSTAPPCARPTPRSSTSCCPTATASSSAGSLREWTSMPIIVPQRRRRGGRRRCEALEAGADDYVTKPFGPRELVARLGAALRRVGDAPGEPAIEVDGLRVDLNAARRAPRRRGDPPHADRVRPAARARAPPRAAA